VIPGIAAYVLFEQEAANPGYLAELLGKPMSEIGTIVKSDEAYPWLLKNFVPSGIRGLAFAALVAAIVSSLASMINSTSTIFTIDIYRPLINPKANEADLVRTGRWVALLALVISTVVAEPLLGGFDQVFQYIQEYTGLIYPGVAVVFAMGLFWKKASTRAAIAAALLTFPFGIGAKLLFPEIPFLLRMGYVFIALVAVASLITFLDKTDEVPDDGSAVEGVEPSTLTPATRNMMVRSSYIFGAIGLASLAFCLTTLGTLADIGVEAFIFFATAMSMIGLVLYTNAKSPTADRNAIRFTPEIFQTGMIFNLGAIGITLIVAILYVIFW
ncbi:MAG: sodium/glucose cotransporter, partial [Bacteroidota bacterium]